MPKIAKVTPWTRFVLFIRGLLLYNTVYWSRASDGLRPPKATRAERREKRPVRNLAIIKPREKPRAKLESDEKEDDPGVGFTAAADPLKPVKPASETGRRKVRKRRRRKHSHMGLSPMDAFAVSTSGMLNKLFGRKND